MPSPAERCEASFIDQVCTTLVRIHEETAANMAVAMGQLEDGTYGYCVDCLSEIPPERLDALTFAIRCTSCDAKLRFEHVNAV